MLTFCWIADKSDPPPRWDLRRRGWKLCRATSASGSVCTELSLLDARSFVPAERATIIGELRGAGRLIVLGVDEGTERAGLLERGCAEALPSLTGLDELAARASRVAELGQMLPRCRAVGPLTLDLLHRDARIGPTWIGLHPREFGLLWRLAEEPGERVTRRQLLRDVWRIHHEPETNSVEVHVSRLRGKLAGAGCEDLVETASAGGYRLVAAGCSATVPFSEDGSAARRAPGAPAGRITATER